MCFTPTALLLPLPAPPSLLFPGPAGPAFPCVVSTYEIVMADIKALARYNWKYVVVDEGHRLKNFECKLIRDLRMLPADNKLLLTGGVPARLTHFNAAAALPALLSAEEGAKNLDIMQLARAVGQASKAFSLPQQPPLQCHT